MRCAIVKPVERLLQRARRITHQILNLSQVCAHLIHDHFEVPVDMFDQPRNRMFDFACFVSRTRRYDCWIGLAMLQPVAGNPRQRGSARPHSGRQALTCPGAQPDQHQRPCTTDDPKDLRRGSLSRVSVLHGSIDRLRIHSADIGVRGGFLTGISTKNRAIVIENQLACRREMHR